MRSSIILTIVAALLAIAGPVAADPPAGVVIRSSGPAEMRVHVARGDVFPCTSSSNVMLYDGALAPGARVEMTTTEACLCVEHTRGAFNKTDFAPPERACRPMVCSAGRKFCRPAADQTIRMTLSSE